MGTPVSLAPNGSAALLTGVTLGHVAEKDSLSPYYSHAAVYLACQMGANIGGGTSFSHLYRTYYPIEVHEERALTHLVINVITPAAAGKKCRVGIYERTGNSTVGALLFDSGPIAIDAAGTIDTTISYTLPRGHYFLSLHTEAAVTLSSSSLIGHLSCGRIVTSATVISAVFGYYEAKTFGPMDAVGTLTMNTSSTTPQLLLR